MRTIPYMKHRRENRRHAMRRAVQLPCQVVREEDFRLVGDRAVDLTPEGMLIVTDRMDLEVGQSLIISFQATEFGIWFDTEATVARIIKGKRKGDIGRAVGVRFQGLENVKRLILRSAFHGVPPPVPRRRAAAAAA